VFVGSRRAWAVVVGTAGAGRRHTALAHRLSASANPDGIANPDPDVNANPDADAPLPPAPPPEP
jgi:hypothetical protein